MNPLFWHKLGITYSANDALYAFKIAKFPSGWYLDEHRTVRSEDGRLTTGAKIETSGHSTLTAAIKSVDEKYGTESYCSRLGGWITTSDEQREAVSS